MVVLLYGILGMLGFTIFLIVTRFILRRKWKEPTETFDAGWMPNNITSKEDRSQ